MSGRASEDVDESAMMNEEYWRRFFFERQFHQRMKEVHSTNVSSLASWRESVSKTNPRRQRILRFVQQENEEKLSTIDGMKKPRRCLLALVRVRTEMDWKSMTQPKTIVVDVETDLEGKTEGTTSALIHVSFH